MKMLLVVVILATATAPAAQPKVRITLNGHADVVHCMAFSPDGKTLASGSEDKTIKLWDAVAGKNTATLEGNTGTVSCLAFSPDGKTLAKVRADKEKERTIEIWDVETDK